MTIVLTIPTLWPPGRVRAFPDDCPTSTYPADCTTAQAFDWHTFPLIAERLFHVPRRDEELPLEPAALVLVDADRDCDLDAVSLIMEGPTVGLQARRAVLFLSDNQCFGHFAEPVRFPIGGDLLTGYQQDPIGMVSLDADTDGFPDIAVLLNERLGTFAHFQPRVRIVINSGDVPGSISRFILPGADEVYDLPPVGSEPPDAFDIAAADLDRDGDDDLVVVGRLSTTGNCGNQPNVDIVREFVWILWNDGDGTTPPGHFTITRYEIGQEDPACYKEFPVQVACADLNNDAATNGIDIVIGFEVMDANMASIIRAYTNHGEPGSGTGGGHDVGERFNFSAADDECARDAHSNLYRPVDMLATELSLPASHSKHADVAISAVPAQFRGIAQLYINPADIGSNPADLVPDYPVDTDCGTNTTRIRSDDLDRDGFNDLVLASSIELLRVPVRSVSVALNAGDALGTFPAAATLFPSGVRNVDVAVGDVNGDGCPDAVGLGKGVTGFPFDLSSDIWLSVFYGDCTGRLRQQYVYSTLFNPCVDIDCGEFTGDARTDIIVTQITGHPLIDQDADLRILRQEPDGTFSEETLMVLPGDGVESAVANLDADTNSRADVASIYADPATQATGLQVMLNGGGSPPGFSVSASGTVTDGVDAGTNLSDIVAADVNTDGHPDLVMSDRTSPGRIWIALNDGAGGFAIDAAQAVPLYDPSSNGANGPAALVACDLNTDGAMDVAVACTLSHTVAVMLNEGGTISGAAPDDTYPVGDWPIAIACGVFNSDEYPDLATVNAGGRTVSVLFNNPSSPGVFGNRVDYFVGVDPIGLTACDTDGDCLDDIVVACDGSTSAGHEGDVLVVLLNNPRAPGVFAGPRVLLPAGSGPMALTSCNLDDLCGPEIIDAGAKTPDHQTPLRITHTASLFQRGEFRADCLLDGDDVAGFVRTYANPSEASRRDFYAADMNADGAITQEDLECFTAALVTGELCAAPPYCTGPGGGGERSSFVRTTQGQPAPSGSASEGPRAAEPRTPQGLVTAWDLANPRSAYADWSDSQYASLRMRYMAAVGFVSVESAEASCRYFDWLDANPRSAYPALRRSEYTRLCTHSMVQFGVFRTAHGGFRP